VEEKMVKEQICWEDVEVGYELPTLEKIAHSLMLVKWAGASGDFNPHHYEEAFGQSNRWNHSPRPAQARVVDSVGDQLDGR
jgi:hypothetical protein